MRIAVLVLSLVVALLVAPLMADAGEGAQIHFQDTVKRTIETVKEANRRVHEALEAQDFNAWIQAHGAYTNALVLAVPELEKSISKFMLGTLEGGGQLDQEVLDAIDAVADEAAVFAKQRVITGAYATLTRRGVRPDSRGAALKLLQKQGVYSLDGRAVGADRPTPMVGLGPSPMAGRVPTTPEAAQFLSKWQYAFMSAEALGPRIAAYETQIEDLPDDAPNRGDILARKEQARTEYEQLLQAIQDYSRKYYEAGGK